MKKRLPLQKTQVARFLNFPVFIFAGIVLISVVSIFGSRWTRSANTGQVLGTVDCSKTGAMGGNVPWSADQARDVYTKMNKVGLKWYMLNGIWDS
jgi:hypothetical protein